MRNGNRIWRVAARSGGPVGYMVTAGRSGRPLAWVNLVCTQSLAQAQDIARSPERTAEFADCPKGRIRGSRLEWLLSFSVKDLRDARTLARGVWRNVLLNTTLWPVDRNGRRVGNGHFACGSYQDRKTVDGKAGLAFFMIVRYADTVTVDKKSGFARCNYIPGLGRTEDTEAETQTVAVANKKSQVGLKAKDNAVQHRTGVASVA